MTISRTLYTAGLALANGVLAVTARGEGKLSRAVRGMRGSVERLQEWGARHRETSRPLIWFHAPSVGEGYQAKAVMEALARQLPDAQILYTFFSPSAELFARGVAADVVDYLPPDLPRLVTRVLDAVRPDVIAFSKTEVWPNLTREATRRGIPTLLLSATLPASASRLRAPARTLLRETHAELAMVGAISEGDSARYAALGVSSERRRVMGDARFDQVWRRARGLNRDSPLFAAFPPAGLPILVAGSTWPADEDRLLDALLALNRSSRELRLIIAPHEPTEAALARLEIEMDRRGIDRRRWSDAPSDSERKGAVIVNRLGILGDLYALADIAYVGGGFGRAGLHSVLEPAAFGAPILFGPRHSNSREARDLIRAGAAAAVADATALEDHLRSWLTDEAARQAAGSTAARYVEEGQGAAERGARLVLDLVSVRPVP